MCLVVCESLSKLPYYNNGGEGGTISPLMGAGHYTYRALANALYEGDYTAYLVFRLDSEAAASADNPEYRGLFKINNTPEISITAGGGEFPTFPFVMTGQGKLEVVTS